MIQKQRGPSTSSPIPAQMHPFLHNTLLSYGKKIHTAVLRHIPTLSHRYTDNSPHNGRVPITQIIETLAHTPSLHRWSQGLPRKLCFFPKGQQTPRVFWTRHSIHIQIQPPRQFHATWCKVCSRAKVTQMTLTRRLNLYMHAVPVSKVVSVSVGPNAFCLMYYSVCITLQLSFELD